MGLENDLKKINLFEHLSDDELLAIASFSTKHNYKKGEILFYEKEQPKALTLLVSGRVKVYKTDLKNNEIILHRFEAGDLIAERAVLDGIPYPASAMFHCDGSIIEINFEKFKSDFLIHPEVAFNFFRSLSKKIHYLEDVISLNIVLDSTSRVAKYLCENSDALRMKNNELAKHLHMSPETLSRILKKFTKLGFLEKGTHGYEIVNKEGLVILYE